MDKHRLFESLLYIYFACLLLIMPLPWLLGWALAVVFHECGHWLAVLFCGGKILGFSMIPGRMNMVATPMSGWQHFFCIISGPAFGLIPVLYYRQFPQLAVCAFFLTAYNLIPLRPLDGGRMTQLLFGRHTRAFRILEITVMVSVFIASIYLLLYQNVGIFPVAVSLCLVIRNQKSLANKGQAQYNIPTETEEV